MADLGSGQCCSRNCDCFQAKGSNIRRFYLYIAAAIGVMLILFFFGSCLGCGACFECAAVCDDSCDCGLEDCGHEIYEEIGCGSCNGGSGASCSEDCAEDCDACVRSEGVTCGNTENCGACAGCGDCSACEGQKMYRVTIIVGDETHTLKLYDPTEQLPIYYPAGANSSYFEFVGYWTKAGQKGTRYVNAEGNYVGDLQAKDGLTLYGSYNELGVGQEYTMAFDTLEVPYSPNFIAPNPIIVTVGEPIVDFPEPQEIEGYKFKGWYTFDPDGSGICVTDENGYYKSDVFHLYDVGVRPNELLQTVVLVAKYEKRSYPIQLIEVRDGIQVRVDAVSVQYGEYLISSDLVNKLSNLQGDGNVSKYIGLSWEMNPDITDATKMFDVSALNSIIVEEELKIYVINRTVAIVKIHYGVSGEQTVEYKSYYGETINLNDIQDSNNGYQKTGDVVADVAFNKGYAFDGWCLRANASSLEDKYTEITVNRNVRLDYYARWKMATYTITYYGPDSTTRPIREDTYNYQTGKTLYDPGYDPVYGTFKGWCENPDCSDEPKTFYRANEECGNKVLYAKYEK